MAKRKNDGGMRWIGDGTAYVPGAPMRDITPDEWHALPEDVQRTAQASGLYVADVDAPPAQMAEESSNDDQG